MSPTALAIDPVAAAARQGLQEVQKTLPPWLFYDDEGSQLFEHITTLPEYYLTRTERAILSSEADRIIAAFPGPITLVELGAGTAVKTGLLLEAAMRVQPSVLYQPIDVSPSALAEARKTLERAMPGVVVHPQALNYTTEKIRVERPAGAHVLALYIGSSIGNFSPAEALTILAGLRSQLLPGDALLLGADLAPGPNKSVETLLCAYDDTQGVTAAFNRNVLVRLNRELGANFDLDRFRHKALWNRSASRIEMHLESTACQTVLLPADASGPSAELRFEAGETIHTENSYKFTQQSLAALVISAGFTPSQIFHDADQLFAVTLATVAV